MKDDITAKDFDAIIQEEMLKLLSDTTPFKPDPSAPFPRWFRRLMIREYIKAERERRKSTKQQGKERR